jgi:hypothetical protein
MLRSFILIAVAALWSVALPYFQKFYMLPIALFYSYWDEEGRACIDVQSNREGFKQGDTVATTGYGITAHYFIYNPLALAYPFIETQYQQYNIDTVAIVDGFTAVWDCPPENSSDAQWNDWWYHISQYYLKFNSVANPIGIFSNLDKFAILVPEYAHMPPDPSFTNGVDLRGCVKKDGIVALGSPIGTYRRIYC